MSNPNKDVADLTTLFNEKFTRRKDIAPVETSSTASRAYSAGDKFYYNNLLQKATTDIAQGATLVSGTNFENADPVCTTLQNLSNQVSSLELTNAVNIIPFDCISRDIYTVHSDGSVDMVNASAGSGETRLYYIDTTESQFSFIKGKRYKLVIFGTFPLNCTFNINFWNGTSLVDGIWTAGNVKYFEWKSTYKGLRIVIIAQKSVVMNTTLKPMIVPEDFPITEWLPVAKSNRELTTDKVGMDLLSEVGAVNHLPRTMNTRVAGGITWTINDDDTVSTSGTASGETWVQYASGLSIVTKEPMRFTGTPTTGSSTTYFCDVECSDSTEFRDYDGNGVIIPAGKTINTVYIAVKSGVNVNGLTFKPMIAPVEYTGPYVPYAKTNRELTEDTTVVNEYSRVTNVNSKITPALNTNLLTVVRYGRLVTFHVYIGDATDLTAWSEELLKLPTDLAPLSDLYINSGGVTGKSVVLRNTGSLNVVTGSETLHGNSFDATYICRG